MNGPKYKWPVESLARRISSSVLLYTSEKSAALGNDFFI